MRRYTTPTYTFTINDVDLSDMDVYVTFSQGCINLTKSDTDIVVAYADNVSTVEVYLSQDETASFMVGRECKVQVNAINEDGDRVATKEKTIKVTGNLLEQVIAYDG